MQKSHEWKMQLVTVLSMLPTIRNMRTWSTSVTATVLASGVNLEQALVVVA
jgi:hypothetical protein